ncbi:MAG: sugar nucleotide-binding protein, partial [Bacteroidota bacterium]
MPQKILITGANGLLGQKLVALILNHPEYELIATARGENRNAAGKYVYEELDITSKEHIDQVLHRHQPDIIINTAAMTHVDQCELNPEQCQLLNVTAVQYLIEVSEQINAFFIHLSTDFIFDGTSGPYREEDEP